MTDTKTKELSPAALAIAKKYGIRVNPKHWEECARISRQAAENSKAASANALVAAENSEQAAAIYDQLAKDGRAMGFDNLPYPPRRPERPPMGFKHAVVAIKAAVQKLRAAAA